jgi:hypothetical protein
LPVLFAWNCWSCVAGIFIILGAHGFTHHSVYGQKNRNLL